MAKAFLAIAFSLALACSAHAVAPEKAPKWAQLNSQQQAILAPLGKDWDSLSDFRRKKWLGIAKRYPDMKPEEQQRMQTRMREWASLTPQQRRLARENFKKIEKLPPEKKQTVKEKWEEYQRLPEEEKRKLEKSGGKPPSKPAVSAAPAPPGTTAPSSPAPPPAGK
jgi:hypothetical protein